MAPGAGGVADRMCRQDGVNRKSHEAPLPRVVSDISAELSRKPLSVEVEEAQCECCGLSEECTPTYICRVKELFCGRWICGLCTEAVKEERCRMGGGVTMEDALHAHMALCEKFNKVSRSNPALHMADALRQLLRKSNGLRSKPVSITRSSSCIPAIASERTSRSRP